MIHANLNVNPTKFLVRPLQRTAYKDLDRTKLIYLVKFTSDLQQRTVYAYTNSITDVGNNKSNNLYSEITFNQVTKIAEQDVYKGKIHLLPAGYWYYVICEVHFPQGTSTEFEGEPFDLIAKGYAPKNFENQFDVWQELGPIPSDLNTAKLGIIVEEGKLQVKRTPREVTYTEHKQTQDNYIYNNK